MERKYVLYQKEGEITRVILNKPAKLNSFGFVGMEEDAREVFDALDEAAEDDDVKVVILKGAGRAFCAGQDLTRVGFVYGFGTGQPGERRPSERIRLRKDRAYYEALLNKVFLHPKITIAQVQDHCYDGGLLLMALCDFAIAAKEARLGFPGQSLAGFGGGGECIVNVLIAQVGLRRAVDLLVTGRSLSGEEAATIGLITRMTSADSLESEVEKMATALSLLPRDGIALGKAHRHLAYDSMGLTAGFAQGYVAHTLLTNMRFEPGEYNFFRERRAKGAKATFKERDSRFADLSRDVTEP